MVGLWLGLLTGLTESLSVAARHFFHCAALLEVKPHYEWIPPLMYGCLFALAGAAGSLFARFLVPNRRGLMIPRLIVVALAAGCCFFVITDINAVMSLGVNRVARLSLALGLACLFWRHRLRRSQTFLTVVRYSIPVICLVVASWGGGVQIMQRRHEQRMLAQLGPVPSNKPNVLLVVWDTVRAQNLSLYGARRPTTPTLERLAHSAIVFDHAIATSSWTLPSHIGMFTGRFYHDLPDLERYGLPSSTTTLADILYREGYLTAGFVANSYYCHRNTGLNKGFVHYEDYSVRMGLFDRAVGAQQLWSKVRPFVISRLQEDPSQKTARQVNDEFLKWRDCQSGRPFFAFLNYFDAHAPYYSPPQCCATHGPASIGDAIAIETWQSSFREEMNRPTDRQRQINMEAYDACIAYLDQQLGELLAALERRGDLRNTLVIVS